MEIKERYIQKKSDIISKLKKQRNKNCCPLCGSKVGCGNYTEEGCSKCI